MTPYRVNVSSVQSFYQCRFRWWCEWVQNRVPVATAPALDAGRLLHRAFERHFKGEDLQHALADECAKFRALIPSAHPIAQASATKAVISMEDLIEAMPLWADKYPVDEVLEIEEPFEMEDEELEGVIWIGRPDRVNRRKSLVWHDQNRGLAANMNFGTYQRLAQRHYHEHLYARALTKKYCTKKSKLKYGGTVFNLVRKLKFRTNVGKRNEKVKTAEEMFYQKPIRIDLNGGLHKSVMMSLRQHVTEMMRTEKEWRQYGVIPAPNEKMNGGYSGSSEDPFFKVLIGEISLDDDKFFKVREDTYAPAVEGGE